MLLVCILLVSIAGLWMVCIGRAEEKGCVGLHLNKLQSVMDYRLISLSLPESNEWNPVVKRPILHISD